jgi:hypothetical protein
MRYLVPVLAVMAVVTTGEMTGWSTRSQAAEAQVEQVARQYARVGTIPTSGYRF